MINKRFYLVIITTFMLAVPIQGTQAKLPIAPRKENWWTRTRIAVATVSTAALAGLITFLTVKGPSLRSQINITPTEQTYNLLTNIYEEDLLKHPKKLTPQQQASIGDQTASNYMESERGIEASKIMNWLGNEHRKVWEQASQLVSPMNSDYRQFIKELDKIIYSFNNPQLNKNYQYKWIEFYTIMLHHFGDQKTQDKFQSLVQKIGK